MNCPYCKKELDTDFYPHCFGIGHYYETSHGNEMIELFDKFCFYKGKPPNIRSNINYVPIHDFAVLNNKTLKEIEELYNKLKVFE